MSRSSEIRTQRWKAERQRQQLLQEAALAAAREEEDEEYQAQEESYQHKLPSNPENVLPLNNPNDYYNMLPLLVSSIKGTPYFKVRCSKIANFNEFVDEIYLKVTHLEPYEFDASSSTAAHTTRPASIAFCLLYRAFEMKVTRNQMQTLLSHQDSPFIRAIGALYLRYVGVPQQLWDWLEPLFADTEEFSPERDSSKVMTVAEWIRTLLAVRYRETILPRIPVVVEKSIQAKLSNSATLSIETQVPVAPPPSTVSATEANQLQKGQLCRALYWEDGKWYDARIEEPGSKEGTYWVTYLPEAEYGNQEEVPLSDIRIVVDPSPTPSEPVISSPQPESTDSEHPKEESSVKRARVEPVEQARPKQPETGLVRYDDL